MTAACVKVKLATTTHPNPLIVSYNKRYSFPIFQTPAAKDAYSMLTQQQGEKVAIINLFMPCFLCEMYHQMLILLMYLTAEKGQFSIITLTGLLLLGSPLNSPCK